MEDIIAISCWIEMPKNGAVKKVLTKKGPTKKVLNLLLKTHPT